jgi:RNA-directed DNA polymerase
MKRLGGVYDAIGDWDNLRLAFWRAAKSARRSSVVTKFEANLVGNLRALREDLSNECVRAGGYTRFVIYDPKERIIAAPSFRDRVLHHAIMNVCEPHFDRWLVHDCYACRKGKGRLAALERATAHAARNRWFLKLDIRKYFDSIPHARLLTAMERKIKDRRLLELFARLIEDGQGEGSGVGLPIGSLLSQHLANFYLNSVDRLCLERLKVDGYVRYMDDFVIWGDDAAEVRKTWQTLSSFVMDELGLELKSKAHMNRTEHGMDFCGFRIFPGWRVLNRRSRRRWESRFREIEALDDEGDQQRRSQAMIAFAKEGSSWLFRRRVLARASTARTAAVRGTTPPPTVARPTGTGTCRTTGTST